MSSYKNHRSDDGEAFLPDPSNGQRSAAAYGDGESFGEEYIASALTGEPAGMEAQDEVVDEEWGGPFLELEPDSKQIDSTVAIPEPPRLHKLPPRWQ